MGDRIMVDTVPGAFRPEAEEKVELDPEHASKCDKNVSISKKLIRQWLKKNLLTILTVAGVVSGCIVGLAARAGNPSDDVIILISFPGDVLMRMLKMMILPLVVSNILSGLCKLDVTATGHMGSRALVIYLGTTILAITLGIILALTIHPGDPDIRQKVGQGTEDRKILPMDATLDSFRNLFPDNLVQACFQIVQTVYVPEQVNLIPYRGDENLTTAQPEVNVTEVYVRDLKYVNGMNILGIMGVCIAFGIVMGQMGQKARVMVEFFDCLSEITLRLVNLIMWYAPVGLLFLIAGKLMQIDDLFLVAKTLGLFVLTVSAGLAIHTFGTLCVIYLVLTKRNPYRFLKGLFEAWLTAATTASCAVAMPLTFRCLEENNGIDRRVTRFLIPIATTLDRNGTALFQAVSIIYIAQLNSVPTGIGSIILIGLSVTFASIGTAGVPSAGIVSMIPVLTAAGLPASDVSIIIPVDWFLDRLRTSVNLFGDSFGAGVVYYLSRKDLDDLDETSDHLAVRGSRPTYVRDSIQAEETLKLV